jgi:hypothetical protein
MSDRDVHFNLLDDTKFLEFLRSSELSGLPTCSTHSVTATHILGISRQDLVHKRKIMIQNPGEKDIFSSTTPT